VLEALHALFALPGEACLIPEIGARTRDTVYRVDADNAEKFIARGGQDLCSAKRAGKSRCWIARLIAA
jgi:hypothetical protein